MIITPYTKPGQTGVIAGEPNDVYHANDAFSNTQVQAFGKERRSRFGSTRQFHARYVAKTEPAPSGRHFDIGSAFHDLLLMGSEYYRQNWRILDWKPNFQGKANKVETVERYCALIDGGGEIPDHQMDELCKLNKEPFLEWFSEQPHVPYLQADEAELVDIMWTRLMENDDQARAVFHQDNKAAHSELVFRSDDKIALGFPVQCRLDRYFLESVTDAIPARTCVDVKTIDSLEMWKKDFYEGRGYHRCSPFYKNVTEAVTGECQISQYTFLVCEKKEPFEHVWITPEPEADEVGRRQVNADLMELAICFRTNKWPGAGEEYAGRMVHCQLPAYVIQKEL